MATAAPFDAVALVIESHERYRIVEKTDIGSDIHKAVTASRAVLAGGDVTELCGWALAETTGAAGAVIRLYDGAGIGTEVFARINLNANESNREGPWPRGIRCSTGRIFLEVVSGSVEGVLFWARHDR